MNVVEKAGKKTGSDLRPNAVDFERFRLRRFIESLGSADKPGKLQASFIKHQAAQCGYCIAGMVMRAQALLEQHPHPSEAQIRTHMEPNLCRCGTHMRIIAAIKEVAEGSRA